LKHKINNNYNLNYLFQVLGFGFYNEFDCGLKTAVPAYWQAGSADSIFTHTGLPARSGPAFGGQPVWLKSQGYSASNIIKID